MKRVMIGHGRKFLLERENQKPRSLKVTFTTGVPTISNGACTNHLSANARQKAKPPQRRSLEVASPKTSRTNTISR
jgi:hypothetical protein